MHGSSACGWGLPAAVCRPRSNSILHIPTPTHTKEGPVNGRDKHHQEEPEPGVRRYVQHSGKIEMRMPSTGQGLYKQRAAVTLNKLRLSANLNASMHGQFWAQALARHTAVTHCPHHSHQKNFPALASNPIILHNRHQAYSVGMFQRGQVDAHT